MRPRHFGLAIVLVGLFGAGFLVGKSPAVSGGGYHQLDTFVEVLKKVEDNYVDPVDSKKLIQGAIQGMLHGLDPFSQYLDRAAYADLKTLTEGQFGGLGIVISVRDNYPTVISPLEGTPAYSLGIQSGDVIVKIDGASTRGWTNEDTVRKLRGPEGTPVTITVAREGEPGRDYSITRQIIHVRSVPYAFQVAPGVGYLRLSNFSETTGDEVRAAIDRLEREGAHSLVLDLRDNPGGLLSQAVDVSEAFLHKNSLVVQTRGRGPESNGKIFADGSRPHTEQPLVVLVNGGSASASEIVAGAIQDQDRGLVVGTTSFGKGSVQSLIELPEKNGALKLTTARYYTPSGRSIHRESWNRMAADDSSAGDEDLEAPGDAPADTAHRPLYKTHGGRAVYGGGGITPDLVVKPDTLQPIAREVERRGLFFRFAVHYAAAHKGEPAPAAITPAMWSGFQDLLKESKVPVPAADLAAERGYLERGLRRELARRLAGGRGDEAAFRVASEGDVQLARAIDLLRRARNAGELVRLSVR